VNHFIILCLTLANNQNEMINCVVAGNDHNLFLLTVLKVYSTCNMNYRLAVELQSTRQITTSI